MHIGFIFLFISATGCLFGQDTNMSETIEKENILRFGYSNSNGIKYQQYKSTRFLVINNLNNLNKWTSSKTIYQLNDLPINITTLNFNSVDLLPINYLINSQSTNFTGNSDFVNDYTVFIDSKPIHENFTILFNGYLGSQTGDPLMNHFTNQEFTPQNVNKIPLSGTLSISNRNKKIGYRVSTGYYGSFSTGGDNDIIIASINHYYFGKLNKQIFFSGETYFNFDGGEVLDLKMKFMSFYGWDISPFTTSYIHFENYLHRFQLSLKKIFDNLSVSFKKDGALGEINEGEGILPAKFEQSEYSLYGRWNSVLNSSSELQIKGDLNFYKWQNISNNKNSSVQHYFSQENDFVNYLLSGIYSYHFTNSIRGRLNVHFQSQNSYNMLSGKIDFKKILSENFSLKLSVSSLSNAPNISELYGSYQRAAIVSEGQSEMMASIKGNSELAYMRSNKISVEFAHRALKSSSQIIVTPFAESIYNSIEQNTISSVRLWNTGEILRNAIYTNRDRDIIYGTYLIINTGITEQLFFTMETQAVLKGEYEFLPTLKNYFQLDFTFPKAGTISMNWYYRSKTYWEEYTVNSVNDYYSNSGFDGVLPETSVLNLLYKLTLKPFYIFKSLQFKIIFENIFNGTQKYIPIGNSMNRAFIFEVSGEI